MKNLIYVMLLSVLAVSCINRQRVETVRYNVLDSIPVEKPVLDEKYRFNTEDFKELVTVSFERGHINISDVPSGIEVVRSLHGVKFVSHRGGVEFRLSGRGDNAFCSVVSDSSVLVTLSGVALSCEGGSPLHIATPATAYIQCAGRQTNYLVDIPVATDTVKTAAALSLDCDAVFTGYSMLALHGSRRNAVYSTGRIIVDGPALSVENSVRDGVSAIGGIAIVNGNVKIKAVKDAVKSKRGNVLFMGGNCVLASTGEKGDGVQASSIFMYGGSVDVKTKGAASRGFNAKRSVYAIDGSLSVLTEGDALFAPKKNDYSSSACIKCDESVYIGGGYLNLENRATAGKGINCNGRMQMDGGVLLLRNYGEGIEHPTISEAYASAKGIKCDSVISINGGRMEVLVFGEGERCEGIESKQDLVLAGDADVYVYATDDAINTGGNVTIDGGRLYAYSVANDGIDSNGKITVNGGLVVANGSGVPEQGFDCDFDGNFTVTSGTVVAIGGYMGRSPNMPRSKATTQMSLAVTGMELLRGKYVNLCDGDGSLLLSYRLPRTLESGAVLFSCPSLAENGNYNISVADTVVAASHLGNGLFAGGSCKGADAVCDVRLEALATNVDGEGNVESLPADTTDVKPGTMPPPPFGGGGGKFPPPPPGGFGNFPPPGKGALGMPPPGFNFDDIPDSIKSKFFGPGGKPNMPFPPRRGNTEGYNATNLPGGGW